jgi:hypothetical protein
MKKKMSLIKILFSVIYICLLIFIYIMVFVFNKGDPLTSYGALIVSVMLSGFVIDTEDSFLISKLELIRIYCLLISLDKTKASVVATLCILVTMSVVYLCELLVKRKKTTEQDVK